MLKDKRGQLTLFIIVAVLIVVLIVLFFVINPFKISFSAQNNRIIIGNQVAPIRERISDCMEEVAEEDFFYTIGQNAGYYEQREGAYSIPYREETYYFATYLPEGQFCPNCKISQDLPDLSQTENEFKSFMNEKGGWDKVDRCVNFGGFGVKVESLTPPEERNVKLEFKDDKIIIHIDWMLRIKKGTVSVDISAGKSELMIPFKPINKLASKICDDSVQGDMFDIESPYNQPLLKDTGIIISDAPQTWQYRVYKLQPRDSEQKPPYTFKFAVQINECCVR